MTDDIKSNNDTISNQQILDYHEYPTPGKISVIASKPLSTQQDLAMAYSPGVGLPVLEISKNQNDVFRYTSRGNIVAIISNGSAILGLGNLGPYAAKPVMEGKAVLFKKFADIDGIDIELDSSDPQEIIKTIKMLEPSFGGINLEDIKAPECFIIEEALTKQMSIPVFHDDQHGTAITAVAGIINALKLTNKSIQDIKVVVNGAGAAGISCLNLLKDIGLKKQNALLLDSTGVIYHGREKKANQWQANHATERGERTLAEAIEDADVFLGLSVGGVLSQSMVKSMNKNPIIFALANPEPEIRPEKVYQIRQDAIVATGRSDYPNQINNVICFPFLFRGALDVKAKKINQQMKIAAVTAIAELAQQKVTDEVSNAYGNRNIQFGKNYIIPTPFDNRLMRNIPPLVAKAAIDSGVAQIKIISFEKYSRKLQERVDPTANILNSFVEIVKRNPKNMIFSEGEQERTIIVAENYVKDKLGKAILIGNEKK